MELESYLEGKRIGIAFNGGKESLVAFDMFKDKAVLFFRLVETGKEEFPEIEGYLLYMQERYGFQLHDIPYGERDKLVGEWHLDVVILGCRRTDPGCESLPLVAPTDPGWPSLIRVNPLINWTYKDVWDYILSKQLPVCSLYEMGYTSLGYTDKTFPNSLLFDEITGKFQHAALLPHPDKERAGRIGTSLPLHFQSQVIKGKGMGKVLGFPTANMEGSPKADEGVYCGWCYLKGKSYPMVMSVGTNPQFGDKSCEVHILHTFEEDFYGETLSVTVTDFIRQMEKYNSLTLLKNAILRDIKIANYHFSSLKMNEINFPFSKEKIWRQSLFQNP